MKIFQCIKNATMRIFPVFLFFLVFFVIINWTETYLYTQAGLPPVKFLEIVIAAGLISKILLVVDRLKFLELFKKYPLISNILWKIFVYSIILLLVRLLIRFVPYIYYGKNTFSNDFQKFANTVNWDIFISIQIYYVMLLVIFVTFRELTYKIGVQKMKEIFFK